MEILSSFPSVARKPLGSKYEPLLDGRVYKVTVGDYNGLPLERVREGIRAAAKVRGLRVRSSMPSDASYLIIQARRPAGRPKADWSIA